MPITLGQEFGGFAANVRARARRRRAHRRAAARAEPRRHRGRHRAERRRRLHRARDRATSRAPPACRCVRPRTASASPRAWATCSPARARCAGWRWRSARSRPTCGCSAWDRAPGSPRSSCPPVQPGSSIMPGKVNPSVPEMVNQVCYQVIGCDAAILAAADAGQLELNVMMPVIAWNALHATRILGNAMRVLARALRRRHPGRRGALPRAARSQHRGRHRAQPVHRLRCDGRHREDRRQDRPDYPRAGARARPADRRAARRASCRPKR